MHYGETFAPVIKRSSVRSSRSTVANQDLEFHQMEAKTAFLNGEIQEDIYIKIPESVQLDQVDIDELGLKGMDELKKAGPRRKIRKVDVRYETSSASLE